MVQFKTAVWTVLVGLTIASAFPHRTTDHETALEKRDVLFPRSAKSVDPSKIERMRSRLGPQQPKENQGEVEENEPKSQPRPKAPGQKNAGNKKSNDPPPPVVSNDGKQPQKTSNGKKQQSQEPEQPQRKPVAPKRPSPRDSSPKEIDGEEDDYRPSPQRSSSKPKSQGKPRKQQPQQPEEEPARRKSSAPQRPAPKKQAPQPEADEGANQQSPQTGRPGGAEKKQKPNKGEKPKLPTSGPSKFQNKKAEKLGGLKIAPQTDVGNDEQQSKRVPVPDSTKQPQSSPDITQGGPKDRSDGSRNRKQAKPDGSRYRKQGSAEDGDDAPGSERAAKGAIESAGAPKDSRSNPRKSNAPRTKNQATAKRPPPPESQSGAAEADDEIDDEPEVENKKKGRFAWFKSSEERPINFVSKNKEGWKTKLPDAEEAAPQPPPPAPATGLDKLPMNQRQREKEQREQEEAAAEAAANEKNRKALRREGF